MSLAPVLPADPGRSNDRVLPHDLLAEQSTLGAMLISQEAVAEVFEYVHGPDFYAPKHQIIFEALLTLYGMGEPTDVITVTDQLVKTGSLVRSGGADYLHTLTSTVPTAANASFYAKIVQEKQLFVDLLRLEHASHNLATPTKVKSLIL